MVQADPKEADQETGQAEAEIESPAVNINQSLVSRLMERNQAAAEIATAKYIRNEALKAQLYGLMLAQKAIDSRQDFDSDVYQDATR